MDILFSVALMNFDGLNGWQDAVPFLVLIAPMPHDHNADRRHHTPEVSCKVQSRPAHEAGLRQRGSRMV
ncbi:MAG: hypothetical protein ACRYHQ_11515 [Janthinobacterium lividum]